MTLSPTESRQVRGVSGPAYKVGPRCSNPGCERWADDGHHIWRRSLLGGPFDWVEFEGKVLANRTGVCRRCHDDLTCDRARIVYQGEEFFWAVDETAALLDPQPPTPQTLSSDHSPASEPCPFCGQPPRRRVSPTTLRARRRKTWRVLVPDDAEDGAEILDTLIADIGLTLGVDPAVSGRYHILLPVLYHACQSKAALVNSLKGIGG